MSIHERALLVNLSISQWYNRATDKKVLNDVSNMYAIENNRDRYVKELVEHSALEPVEHAISRIRAYHTKATLPWGDNSMRILPSIKVFEYRSNMAQLKQNLDVVVDNFINDYPDCVERAKATKGELFNPKDYPPAEEVRDRFKCRIALFPVPDVSDFRINVSEEEMAEIRAQSQEHFDRMIGVMNRHLIERLVRAAHPILLPKYILENNTLTKNDLENKVTYPRHIQNLLDTVDLVTELNMSDDPKVNAVLEDIHQLTKQFRYNGLESDVILVDYQLHMAIYDFINKWSV